MARKYGTGALNPLSRLAREFLRRAAQRPMSLDGGGGGSSARNIHSIAAIETLVRLGLIEVHGTRFYITRSGRQALTPLSTGEATSACVPASPRPTFYLHVPEEAR